jgi:hypothetical protein
MAKIKVTDYFLYRHRYLIGYVLLGLVFAAVLVAAQFATGDLSQQEMASAVSSTRVTDDFFSASIVNLPFKLLQMASINIFGLSVFSVKLPATILAAASGVALFFLLRHWSKMYIVIPASILIVASSAFLFSAQNGTPNILYILLPMLIVLLGHIAASSSKLKLWASLSAAAVLALSLYTPFLVYFVLAIVVVAFAHPYVRLTVRNSDKRILWASLAVFVLLAAPLVVASVLDTATIPTLLTNNVSNPSVLNGARAMVTSLFFSHSQTNDSILTPIYGLPLTALIVIGFFYGLREKHRTKYYVLLGWLAVSFVVLVFDPHVTTLIFVPLALLITKGLAILIQKWYEVFPDNPYARVAGLVPITFLIVAICTTSAVHFVLGHRYSPQVASSYNNDISLVRANLVDNTAILTEPDSLDYDFYKILEQQGKATVLSELPDERFARLITIGHHGATKNTDLKLVRIVTSGMTHNADRLYIYE